MPSLDLRAQDDAVHLLDLIARLSDRTESEIVNACRAAAEMRRNRDRLGVDQKGWDGWVRGREAILDNEELSEFVPEASAFSDGCTALLDSHLWSQGQREEFERWQAVGYLDPSTQDAAVEPE